MECCSWCLYSVSCFAQFHWHTNICFSYNSMFERTVDFIGNSGVVRQTQHSTGIIVFQTSGKLNRLIRSINGAGTSV